MTVETFEPGRPVVTNERKAPSGRQTSFGHLKKAPYPHLFGKGLLTASKLRVMMWDRALRDVEGTQLKILRDLTTRAGGTEFGRRFGLSNVRSYADYRERTPVGDYDSFSASIDAMRRGQANILVPEKIMYFGNSSGSSTKGKSKFLPISERQIKESRGMGTDALMRYLAFHNDSEFPTGYTMGLVPPITMKADGPTFVTTNPSLMYLRTPKIANAMRLPERDVLSISDYDKKLAVIADRYLDHDIRTVIGTTCWFSVLFDKLLEAARARGRNVSTVAELWPNLKFVIGGGVSAAPYMPIIKERMGRDDMVLVDTYNATEGGIYACTDHTGEPGMLMIPDRGVFFEFIPVDGASDLESNPWPRRVPLWEVEKGKLYAIVVTTSSGLYSYRLGDLVRFTSTRPHRIEFAGRLSGCLSTTQELTTHVEIERAVAHALAVTSSRTVEYGCGADVGVDGSSKSRYVLFAEFEGRVPDLDKFALAFDEGMSKENRVYREHRIDDLGILRPEVVALPTGTAPRFMQDIGNTSVQTKFPRILDDDRKERLRGYVRARQN